MPLLMLLSYVAVSDRRKWFYIVWIVIAHPFYFKDKELWEVIQTTAVYLKAT